jgi:hypothetical protein
MITIAQQCVERLTIGRELLASPEIVIRERPSQNRPTITYLDESGNKTTRAAIASHYGVSNKCINDWHNKSELDWAKTHKGLRGKL